MREKISIAIVVGIAILASACGPVPLAQYGARRVTREVRGIKYDAFAAQPLSGDLSAYNRLAVEPLQNQVEDKIPAELVASLDAQLFEQLRRVKRLEVARSGQPDSWSGTGAPFHNDGEVIHVESEGLGLLPRSATVPPGPGSSRKSVRPADSAARTVILRGAIVDFDEGNQGMRLLQVGVGREGVLTLHLWLVDGATGRTLAKYIVNSEADRLKTDSGVMVARLSKGVGELVAGLLEKGNQEPAKAATPPTAPASH